jgi:hypothetical protein
MTADLAERIGRIEDLLAIQDLQALYARYADNGWPGAVGDSTALAGLFAPDGVWSSERVGTFTGREEIIVGLGGGSMPFSMHLLMSPHIMIEGDQASGTWRALFALTTGGGDALWAGGGYQVSYVRLPEGWRISRLETVSAFMSPYGQSWAKA